MATVVDDDPFREVPADAGSKVVDMPTKRPVLDPDDTVRRYKAGETLGQIARDYRTRTSRVRDVLVANGVPIRPPGTRAPDESRVPTSEVVKLYGNGMSAEAIAEHIGCAVGTVCNRLHAAGVSMRSGAARVERAHAAARAKVYTVAERERAARIVEANPSNVSPYEVELRAMLAERGVETVPQKAVGVYNVDLAAAPVAVEIFGGNWHFAKDHRERFRYLADRGWASIVVWVDPRQARLFIKAAEQVILLRELARRDPAARGQYWMVRCTGEVCAAGSVYSDDFALVRPGDGVLVKP